MGKGFGGGGFKRLNSFLGGGCIRKFVVHTGSESGDNWVVELEDDILEECSSFGPILHLAAKLDSEVIAKKKNRVQCRPGDALFSCIPASCWVNLLPWELNSGLWVLFTMAVLVAWIMGGDQGNGVHPLCDRRCCRKMCRKSLQWPLLQ